MKKSRCYFDFLFSSERNETANSDSIRISKEKEAHAFCFDISSVLLIYSYEVTKTEPNQSVEQW